MKEKMIINKENIAWAAGFYDGEGSVSCRSNNGNPHTLLQLSIGQKNDGNEIAETLKKFKSIVGCGHIYRKTRIGIEINQHQFFVSKQLDVIKVINLLWPYLSITKKNQANKAWFLFKRGQRILKVKKC